MSEIMVPFLVPLLLPLPLLLLLLPWVSALGGGNGSDSAAGCP